MDGKLATRLRRIAAAYDRSREAYRDDLSALRAVVREADEAGWSVREIASHIGKSPSHTHRIMTGLSGGGA